MDFFSTLIEYLGLAVLLLGVAIGAIGGIQYGMAHSNDDAAKKTSAMHTIVGGIIIGLIGVGVVPLIVNYIPTV